MGLNREMVNVERFKHPSTKKMFREARSDVTTAKTALFESVISSIGSTEKEVEEETDIGDDSAVRVPESNLRDVSVGLLLRVWLIVQHGVSVHPQISVSVPSIPT